MSFTLKLYYTALPIGVILGTWVDSWLYALAIVNLSLALIIWETFLEGKYGRKD